MYYGACYQRQNKGSGTKVWLPSSSVSFGESFQVALIKP
jgi:hypothetical protein